MIEKICIGVIIFVSFYIFYKLKMEKRYNWVSFDNDVKDPNGVVCDQLIYMDRLTPGLQVKYFYEFELDYNKCSLHIKSLNTNHRIERNSKYLCRN